MDLELAGLRVVVTGGSAGIGAAIARTLAAGFVAGANWYADGGSTAHVQF